MLKFIPYRYKILILTLQTDEVEYLISSVTETPESTLQFYEQKDKIKDLFKFRGIVDSKKFIISRKSGYYQPFVPLIIGKIDTTSNGCIVHLTFKLFNNTQYMLLLSTLFFFGYGVVKLLHEDITTSGIFFGLCLLNYIVAFSNFNVHTREALKQLNNVLSWD